MMKDKDVANAVMKWWRRFHEGVLYSQTETMVRAWILQTAWGPLMLPDERIKLQNRVSALIRSANARKAAKTRKTKQAVQAAAVQKKLQLNFL